MGQYGSYHQIHSVGQHNFNGMIYHQNSADITRQKFTLPPLARRHTSQYYSQERRPTAFGCHPWSWVGGGSITDRNLTVSSVPSITVLQSPYKDKKNEMVKLKPTERKENNKTDENS